MQNTFASNIHSTRPRCALRTPASVNLKLHRASLFTSKRISTPSPYVSKGLARNFTVSARQGGGSSFSYSTGPDLKDRAVAAVPYLLPFIAAFSYGKFIFREYPVILSMIGPMVPLINLYYSIPFASLVLFLAVYAGIVTNDYWSRFVRYNAMQAVLLDIALIVPRLLEGVIGHPSTPSMVQMYISFNNCVWIFIAGSVAYSMFMCLTGQTARIPIVSAAVDQQVR